MPRDAKTLTQYTHLVGVDEAGRGSLAGPVAVCAVKVAKTLDIGDRFPGVKDSKLMTPAARERVYGLAEVARKEGVIEWVVSYGSQQLIDHQGITKAVMDALNHSVTELTPPREVMVYLDGLLHAPKEYRQETIVKGDLLIPVISLASVIAKVSRDRLMVGHEASYPGWGFATHKGYGTKSHYQAIRSLGLCDLHRTSFVDLT